MSSPGVAPAAESGSYYGRPVLKDPAWKVADVTLYLLLGGMAGASSVLGAAADLTGRRELARVARLTAGASVLGGVAALIHDLGRPGRFLNMLRVFKPTSPLSVGSWTLASYGPMAGAAAVSELSGVTPRAGRAAGVGAAVLGPVLTTYTAVLIADTAVPAWHDACPELSFAFGGSAVAAAAGVMLAAAPLAETGPARRSGIAGAVIEVGATEVMRRRLGLVGEPYRQGRSGRLITAARAFGVAGAAGALLGRRSRLVSAAAGASLVAGSAALRLGVFEAGVQSARDPKYTVVPQRERLDASPAGGSQ
jgi:hypothetical protein